MAPRTRTRTRTLLLLLVLLLALPVVAGAEDKEQTVEQWLAEKNIDAVVSIRFVLKMRIAMGGNSNDDEASREVRGVLVDASGLVLTASSHFDGGLPPALLQMLGDEIDLQATPSDLMVLFGEEEEEYEARLVAKDSDRGLAFVQIVDLKGRQVKPLDLAHSASVQVGEDLLGLTRMHRSFDCAARVDRLYAVAEVERPRPMWAVAGDFTAVGMPVFTRHGHPVGILTLQQGTEGVSAGGGGDGLIGLLGAGEMAEGMGLFVLPMSSVKPVIAQALARAAEPVEGPKGEPEAEPEEDADEPQESPDAEDTEDAAPAEPAEPEDP